MKNLLRIAHCSVWLVALSAASAAGAPTPEQLDFFEKRVRPLLVEHCLECHGSKKQEAGLRLDTHAGFLKGTDGGPVFSGNAEGSRLLKVLEYADGDTQMPPKGKLPAEQIADFQQWLSMGAPWPAESVVDAADPKDHWAFKPVKRPAIPHLTSLSGNPHSEAVPVSQVQTPVDAFITQSLAEKDITLAPPASRYEFIRRATLDLWGVPPTFDQVQEFLADQSPDAAERLIDRLLASPYYGQRWGRHWLDVARYADSKGYVFTAEPRYPYSYTYRDYVVEAMNSDLSYDRFVVEQIAADLVVLNEKGEQGIAESQDSRLAALGFLTVGRRYLNNQNDIIDDRIDVVTRGLLGMTVGCARCHDHKFDPIPTADYYSLYGVFASTTEPEELPVIGLPKDQAAYRQFLAELEKRQADVLAYEKESIPKLAEEIRVVAGDSLQQIAKEIPAWNQTPVAFTGANEPRRPVVQRWKDLLNRNVAQPHPALVPWFVLSKVEKPEDFSAAVTQMVESWANDDEAARVNPLVRQAIVAQKPTTLLELARLYGNLFDDLRSQWTELQKATPEATGLADPNAEQVRQLLYGEKSPANLTLDEARPAFSRDIVDQITNLKRNVDALKVTSPGAPPRAMIVRDGALNDPVIFVRGNPGRRGKPVPRQFLEVVSMPERKPFARGSGRLDLAEAIVDTQNPLTARVITNRVWQHHFGTGIVATPSDFGTRGLPPSHPELLDWLSAELSGLDHPDSPMNWSLKKLHRLIMASSVFQQSAAENPVARGVDPENRLLWRMPRQRLDFESFRDSLLAVSGKLDDRIGGQPFDGVMNPATTRRTLYTLINRNDLPGIFRAFDFADTDASASDRPQTTVPQQSLFAMNSPFMQEQSRRLAADCVAMASNDPERLEHLYQRVFGRQPTVDERSVALQFLGTAETSDSEKLSPWDRLAQVLLMTNEFMFVD
ncbi:PSD1 and planctomycete cytochrome C domain-containing protein [Schlesneria sp. DSM 10557]|uniref:PSD1 and planctomycete cytochrome C domain-containing protein n=1 Tax=Schlesneria sp. DSM 10557 TaxID=3044399 RepID=UPI00359F23F7